MKVAFALVVFGLLMAWWAPWKGEPTFTERLVHFERAVEAYGDDGSGNPVWLMQGTVFGPAHIAVIFGFLDDMDFCEEVVEGEKRRNPESRLYCVRSE